MTDPYKALKGKSMEQIAGDEKLFNLFMKRVHDQTYIGRKLIQNSLEKMKDATNQP